MLRRWNTWLSAETLEAVCSSRTRTLSRRELARPPSTEAPTLSGTESGSFSPGTAQVRLIWVWATRSRSTSSTGAARVGTGAAAGVLAGPRAMAPKYFWVSSRALASSMSPDRTRTALFGP
ncbi:hypothetical protein D3C87_1634700 [compost metagenome]